MAIKWTDDEVTLLREVASSHTVTELRDVFGRSATAIYQAGYKYGVQFKSAKRGPRGRSDGAPGGTDLAPLSWPGDVSGRDWTEAEDLELRRHAAQMTLPELAEKLARTLKAVRHRCKKLELVPLDGRSTPEARERARQRRLSTTPTEPASEAPESTKPCVGEINKGAHLPVTAFPWNRSGLSRAPKCVECLNFATARRMAALRSRNRPPGWEPGSRAVDCGPEGHLCTVCEVRQPSEEFYADVSSPCGHSSQCKGCRRRARRDSWAEDRGGHRNRDVVRQSERTPQEQEAFLYRQWVYMLDRKYKLTVARWEELLRSQNGVCALCGEPESKTHNRSGDLIRLAVDHDHRCCPGSMTCGRCVRGLLCYECNLLVGKVEAKPGLAIRFADYLACRPCAER